MPGAGSLARLQTTSPFATHAASPFAESPDELQGLCYGGDQAGGGPAPPDQPALARLPNAAGASAFPGGSDWGCNSSDSEWMRPGPAPGTRRKEVAGPPSEGVLLPWDL